MTDEKCACCGATAVGSFTLSTLNGCRTRTESLCMTCWFVHGDLASVVEVTPNRLFDDPSGATG